MSILEDDSQGKQLRLIIIVALRQELIKLKDSACPISCSADGTNKIQE